MNINVLCLTGFTFTILIFGGNHYAARYEFESKDAAKPCDCKDAAKIRDRAQRASKAEEAWKEIFNWARGLHYDLPLPASNDELDAKFGQLIKAPQSEWDQIMHQPVDLSGKPEPIAGMNDRGEAVISQDFVNQNCDEIVQAVRVHEETHKQFVFNNPIKAMASVELLRVRAESEVEAYRAEKEFLNQLLKTIDKDCCKQNSGGWSGTITFSHIRKKESDSGPRKSPIDATRTIQKKTTDRIDHFESIAITGVKNVISGTSDITGGEEVTADLEGAATGTFIKELVRDTIQQEQEGCPDSLGGGTRNLSNRAIWREIETGAGEMKGIAKVHVSISSGRYSFGYRGPDYHTTIVTKETNTASGGCRPVNNGTKESSNTKSGGFRGYANVEGRGIDPKNPSVLTGSETRSDGTGGTITITWNLTRCK